MKDERPEEEDRKKARASKQKGKEASKSQIIADQRIEHTTKTKRTQRAITGLRDFSVHTGHGSGLSPLYQLGYCTMSDERCGVWAEYIPYSLRRFV